MARWILIIIFSSLMAFAVPSEEIRQKCADQINSAFLMQSEGNTTQAFYAWKHAYTLAKDHGESLLKLGALLDLFVWYRKYGYNCGVSFKPSGCIDEYRSNKSLFKTLDYKDLDARQRKAVRTFLCGTGCVVCGVLCITINSPIGGKFGYSLIIAGGKYMFDAVNDMLEDYEEKKERLIELNSITNKAAVTVK